MKPGMTPIGTTKKRLSGIEGLGDSLFGVLHNKIYLGERKTEESREATMDFQEPVVPSAHRHDRPTVCSGHRPDQTRTTAI
jgi:hypothetical protein